MSQASKLTLAGTSLVAAGIVVFVHYSQQAEKAVSTIPRRGNPPLVTSNLLIVGYARWGNTRY